MLKDILDDMMKRHDRESWQVKEEIWYRVNIMRNGYGFSRMIPKQSEEHAHGLTLEKVSAMVKKGDTVHRVEVSIRRIK